MAAPAPRLDLSIPGLSAGLAPGLPPAGLPTLLGRLVEIAGPARLTFAMSLLMQAQQRREPAAWITCAEGLFFPADALACGLDLAALPLVRVKAALEAARAADLLLRSGAFGLLVLDLGGQRDVDLKVQSRLVGLAQKHATALVCLTDKTERMPSLGSLVSLRLDARREPPKDGRIRCEALAAKDKARGPGWRWEEWVRSPPGVE